MVTDDPVCVSRRRACVVGRSDLSVQIVVKSLEQTISQVHVSDWVDSFLEVNASWYLAVSACPLVLNSFHVPLVDNGYNSLLGAAINHLEEVVVSLINEDALESVEENVHVLNVPVDQMLVKALLSELRWLRVVHFSFIFFILKSIESMRVIHCSAPPVLRQVHSGLMQKSVPGWLVELWSQEVSLGVQLLCFLKSKLDLKSWAKEVVVSWDLEVESE